MASLQCKASGLFTLSLVLGEIRLCRSLETHDEAEARAQKSLIEQRLRQLKGGKVLRG